MVESRACRCVASRLGLPMLFICLAAVTVSAFTVVELVAAACPFQMPHREACIQMFTLCSGAEGLNACEATTNQHVSDAWVGCQASAERLQCLPGLPTNPDDSVTCYVECDCDWDPEGDICRKDHQDCIRHFTIEKYAKACPDEN